MPKTRLGKVQQLQRRNPQLVEALQLTLDVGGWDEPIRTALNRRIIDLTADEPAQTWRFTMVAAREETVSAFLHALRDGPRGFATLLVWNALPPYVRIDTGELLCTQRTLAKTAGVAIGDVSRALSRLVDIGALARDGKGEYRIHPTLMWRGELAKRTEAEKAAPQLTLVPLDGSPPAA